MTAAFVTAFLISVTLTPVFRRLAYRVGYLDIPGDVSSHDRPVPRTGGYAILIGITVAGWLAGAFDDRDTAIAIIAAVVLAIVAAIDDARPLPRFSRLVLQMIIGAAIAYGGFERSQQASAIFGVAPAAALSGIAALVWIVGMINAYNFMDGVNGIAAVEAIVCGSALGFLGLGVGDWAGASLALAIAGACAGFLPWNLPSGSIFMGDVGSATIGLLFALLTLRLSHEGVPFVIASLPLLPFVFDSSVTVALRAHRGERFFATRHRSHFYQRLNLTGYSHAQVTMVYGLMALISSAVALTYMHVPEGIEALCVLGVLAMHVALAGWVMAREGR